MTSLLIQLRDDIIIFGPGVLACATRGGGQSLDQPLVPGVLNAVLVQAYLRAPLVVANEAKLAIVFTYFFFLSFLVQACLRAPHVVADEAKLAIVFTYFFSSSSSPPSTFHPLRGNI